MNKTPDRSKVLTKKPPQGGWGNLPADMPKDEKVVRYVGASICAAVLIVTLVAAVIGTIQLIVKISVGIWNVSNWLVEAVLGITWQDIGMFLATIAALSIVTTLLMMMGRSDYER